MMGKGRKEKKEGDSEGEMGTDKRRTGREKLWSQEH